MSLYCCDVRRGHVVVSPQGRFRAPVAAPPTPKAAPFETRAKSHWSWRKYRDQYGPYGEWESLVNYFQRLTPDPASFVNRARSPAPMPVGLVGGLV